MSGVCGAGVGGDTEGVVGALGALGVGVVGVAAGVLGAAGVGEVVECVSLLFARDWFLPSRLLFAA